MTRRTDGGPVDHAEDQRVFSVFEFDVFGGLHFATWKANVEWDIVGPLVQLVASWDLRSWSIIFPSSPRVSIQPLVG